MAIKPEADQAYFLSNLAERTLALSLAEAFDVEYGHKIDNFGFWFARPQTHAAERFGLSQEVLVLYSHFPRTDARIQTALTKILSRREYKDRAEPVVTLVIHEGTSEEMATLKSPRDRIIVAFQAAELKDPGRGGFFIRSRLAEALGGADLFGVSTSLHSDTYFFGRDPLIEQLPTKTFVRTENTGVFGLRKTGKTSVLNALGRRYRRLVVYLDCESTGLYQARWWAFLNRITALAREQVGLPKDPSSPFSIDDAASRFTDEVKLAIARPDRGLPSSLTRSSTSHPVLPEFQVNIGTKTSWPFGKRSEPFSRRTPHW